jgi:hypothetical protein
MSKSAGQVCYASPPGKSDKKVRQAVRRTSLLYKSAGQVRHESLLDKENLFKTKTFLKQKPF